MAATNTQKMEATNTQKMTDTKTNTNTYSDWRREMYASPEWKAICDMEPAFLKNMSEIYKDIDITGKN